MNSKPAQSWLQAGLQLATGDRRSTKTAPTTIHVVAVGEVVVVVVVAVVLVVVVEVVVVVVVVVVAAAAVAAIV